MGTPRARPVTHTRSLHDDLPVHPRMRRADVVVDPGSVKVMDFDRPAGTTPVSQSPFCHAVAPCGRSPTFVKFSVLPP